MRELTIGSIIAVTIAFPAFMLTLFTAIGVFFAILFLIYRIPEAIGLEFLIPILIIVAVLMVLKNSIYIDETFHLYYQTIDNLFPNMIKW